jgi:trimeric autotransporter adhesin
MTSDFRDILSSAVPRLPMSLPKGNFTGLPGLVIASTFLSLLLPFARLNAQIRSGTITGLVTDPKGAVVVNAEVTVTNTGTHATYSTSTTQAGIYTLPYLETGAYDVSVSKVGFAVETVNGISVSPAQTARADITLRVGATSTSVEVQAAAEQLQTESAAISEGISSQVIEAIPNITENPLYYTGLDNNVQPRNEVATSVGMGTYNNAFGIGVAGRAEFSAIGVNGGRAFTNDIQLDGLPITGDGFNEAAIIPNEEGLQEVRVINNDFTADYGHGQSVMEMTTKSGTNAFHGQANWLMRNSGLNANTFSNKQLDIPRQPLLMHNLGAALAGPIWRSKQLFFFSSFHYLKYNEAASSLITVPTALERVGNFSQTMTQNASGQPAPAQVFNPYQVTQIGPNLYQRALVPNAIVTPNLLPDPTAYAAAVLMNSFWPMPNHPPADVYNDNNFQYNVVNTVRRSTNQNRIDFKHGMHSIYGSGGIDVGNIVQPFGWGSPTFNNYGNHTGDKNYYGQIGDSVAITPTLFVDVRYGVTRILATNFGGLSSGFSVNGQTGAAAYAAFGIPTATQSIFAQPGAAPVVDTSGNPYSGNGIGGGSNWNYSLSGGQFANKAEHQIGHAVNGSVTKLHGAWTFKAGSEYRVQLAGYEDFEEGAASLNSCCSGDPGGDYNFEYTTATGARTPQDSSGLLDGVGNATNFLGQSQWFVRPGANLRPSYAAKYFAAYSQNDWRVKPGLTLNLGLRWDVQPGLTERHNRMTAIDLTKPNVFGTMGTVVFPGANGYPRNLWYTEWHDLQPRVGAAFQIKPSLVLRGGFGITYLPTNTGYFSSPTDYGEAAWASGNEPYEYGSSPNGVPITEFTDASPILPATGANYAAPQNYAVSEALFDVHLQNQLARQANVFLQKSFGKGSQWLVTVGWSDSISRHLTTNGRTFEDLQNVPTAVLDNWKNQYIANNGTADPADELVPNPWQPTSGPLLPFAGSLGESVVPQFLLYLPYPLSSGASEAFSSTGTTLSGSKGYADYNSFQASLRHAYSSGLDLGLNYTWSKELDYVITPIEDGQGVNAGGTIGTPDLVNNQLNKNYGAADMPNRFTGTVVYMTQFGSKGKYALTNPVARAVLGDWSFSTVVLAQSGEPFFLSMEGDGAITSRMDRNVGQPLEVPKTLQHWYTSATTVTLPSCGASISVPAYTYLRYNLCAFQGETLTGANGSIIPNLYWIGNQPQTQGYLRLPRRTNVDLSIRRAFPIYESLDLEIGAEATNAFNHTELNSQPGSDLGNMNLLNDPSSGLIPGIGTNGSYGSIGNSTYDPRQIVLHAVILF